MTRWIDDPDGGRDRGPRAIARAWIEVCVRPRRFFRTGIAPADQAPGLTFAACVVFVAATTHALTAPDPYPVLAGQPVASGVLWVGLLVVLVAPLVLHLLAAVETVLLIVLVPDRGGISETVQVIAYASAPCVLAGVPIPELRVLCTLYASILLILGFAEVHDASLPVAVGLSVIPALVAFGYGFGGVAAAETLLVAR